MVSLNSYSKLAQSNRELPGYVGAARNRLFKLFSNWRARRRTSSRPQAHRDCVLEHIRRTRAKIDYELGLLPWI